MSKVRLWRDPYTPLLLVSFTVVSDHPKAREVLLGRVPKSGAVSDRILIRFWSGIMQSAGAKFSVGPALSLFLSGWLAPHRSGQNPETIVLYDIPTKCLER
jgi:hypothetical protein